MKKRRAISEVKVAVKSSAWREVGKGYGLAIAAAVAAVGPYEFDEKRKIIRFLCDVFSIEPKAL